MTLSEVIMKTQQAVRRTQLETVQDDLHEALEVLCDLRDKAEDFSYKAWNSLDHDQYIDFISLAGSREEIEAQEDIRSFLPRYLRALYYCWDCSQPSEYAYKLAEGWDPNI